MRQLRACFLSEIIIIINQIQRFPKWTLPPVRGTGTIRWDSEEKKQQQKESEPAEGEKLEGSVG